MHWLTICLLDVLLFQRLCLNLLTSNIFSVLLHSHQPFPVITIIMLFEMNQHPSIFAPVINLVAIYLITFFLSACWLAFITRPSSCHESHNTNLLSLVTIGLHDSWACCIQFKSGTVSIYIIHMASTVVVKLNRNKGKWADTWKFFTPSVSECCSVRAMPWLACHPLLCKIPWEKR